MSYSEVNCPYCGETNEINHDDEYGYDENETYNQECMFCDKTFAYDTSISFYHEAWQADCLNGDKHDMRPVKHYPEFYPDWVRCEACGCEVKGEPNGSVVSFTKKVNNEVEK